MFNKYYSSNGVFASSESGDVNISTQRQAKGLIKMVLLLGLGLSTYMLSLGAQAAACTPIGGTKIYNFAMNYNLTQPSQNTTGTVISNAYSWSLGNQYQVSCSCSGSYTGAYITTEVPTSGGQVYTDGTLHYYAISDYLGVASSVYIGGGLMAYTATPFTSVFNKYTISNTCAGGSYSTGSQGAVSLYFRRPFVGVQTIPSTKVVDVFAATDSATHSTTPVATVYMSGSVTVPQNCVINGGGVITIPFGDIMAGDITTKGAMAKNFTPKNQQFTVACSNISDGVKVSLSFQGTPDSNDSTALATTNKDVAVKIENSAGAVIPPVSGSLPLNMNYAAQVGTSEINLYPINTTGNMPATGSFTATATISADIQ